MSGRTLIVLGVLLGIVGGVHVYVWWRLVRAPRWSPRARTAATIALLVLAVAAPLGLALYRVIGSGAVLALSWIGSIWAGTVLILLFTLLAADALRALAWAGRRLGRRPDVVDAGRRLFLARAFAGVTGAGAASLSGIAVASATSPPSVVRVPIAIPRLPAAFEGYAIAQLSDVHVGPLFRRPFLEDVVARTNALGADAIAITGDLVDGSVDDLRDAVAPLADLRARDGVFFVTGNHEYYSGVEPWLEHLRGLGVRVLRNERVEVRRGEAAIDVAGIDDATAGGLARGHGPDLDRALEGREAGRVCVLLAHQPKQVRDAERRDVDLQLSGHTHGGQIAPFGLLVRLVQPLVAGLGRFGPTQLYVSRGTGSWGPPMRLANPAEITLLTLHRRPSPHEGA